MVSTTLELGMSIEKLQQLKDHAKELEESNARLREKAASLRAGQAALDDENESLCKQIEALEAQMASKQGKSNKGRKVKSEESLVFVNRSGERWPRKAPIPLKAFVGIQYERGAAVAALKKIFQQLFTSVVDAANFFGTSLQEIISAAELTRGMARCHIRNLETEHLLFDLDKRIVDGIRIRAFVEAFNWLETPIIVTPQSMAASRARMPQIEQRVAEILRENVAGYNALDFMKPKERSSTVVSAQNSQHFDQRSWGGTGESFQAAPPLDLKKVGRALNVREKYLLSHNQLENRHLPEWINELSDAYYGGKPPKAGKLKTEGKTKQAFDDAVLKQKSSEPSMDMSQQAATKQQSTSRSSTPRGGTGTVQLTTELVSSREHPSVDRIKHMHGKLLKGGRPILSAVTADSTWIKQDRTLAANAAKQASTEDFAYDLDGRLVPKPPPAGAHDSDAEAAGSPEGSSQTSPKAKTRGGKFKQRKAAEDPFKNASPANIAYMMLQKVSDDALANYDRTEDDKVFQHFVDDVIKGHPRAGTVAQAIAARDSEQNATAEQSSAGNDTAGPRASEAQADATADDQNVIQDDHDTVAPMEEAKTAAPLGLGAVSREFSQDFDDHDNPGTPPPDHDPEPVHAEVSQEDMHQDLTQELVHAEVSHEMVAGEVSVENSFHGDVVDEAL